MLRRTEPNRRRLARGTSLVELIMFIVIIGIAVAGVLGAMSFATRASADPLIQKQALAIAEAYLEEVLAMPFTYCDPDDVDAATATSATVGAGACASTIEVIGVEGGETRGGGTTPFDNVSDYNGLSGGPASVDGTAIGGLSSYNVSVSVVAEALSTVAASASLRVTVTVTGPAGASVRLDGYRTRYAPNALP